MDGAMAVYEPHRAIIKKKSNNYSLQGFGALPGVDLRRDVDFGVIPGTKQPSLYKAGAEKICFCYGLMQRYTIDSAIEDYQTPFFAYRVKCELVAMIGNEERVVCCAYGCSNTTEKQCGRASPFDTANSRLKMAQKRALVAAVIAVSGVSDMFTQDIENEAFMSGSQAMVESTDPESLISKKQIQRLYAVGADAGKNAKEVKAMLSEAGYASTQDIKQKNYDEVITLIGG